MATWIVDPRDERMIRDKVDEFVVRGMEQEFGLDLSDGTMDISMNTDKLIRMVQSLTRQALNGHLGACPLA